MLHADSSTCTPFRFALPENENQPGVQPQRGQPEVKQFSFIYVGNIRIHIQMTEKGLQFSLKNRQVSLFTRAHCHPLVYH